MIFSDEIRRVHSYFRPFAKKIEYASCYNNFPIPIPSASYSLRKDNATAQQTCCLCFSNIGIAKDCDKETNWLSREQRAQRQCFSGTHAIAAAYPMPDSMPLEPMTSKFFPDYTSSQWLGLLPLFPIWNRARSGNYEINNWQRVGATTNVVDSWLLVWLPWPVRLWLGRADTAAVVNGEAVSNTKLRAEVTKNIGGYSLLISAAIFKKKIKPWPQCCVLFVSYFSSLFP